MAHTLASFLSADAESISYHGRNGGEAEGTEHYSPAQREFLEAEGERFSLFSAERELEAE